MDPVEDDVLVRVTVVRYRVSKGCWGCWCWGCVNRGGGRDDAVVGVVGGKDHSC